MGKLGNFVNNAIKVLNSIREAATRRRYGSEAFTPVAMEQMTNKQVSSELSRARSILRKRYERAMKQGLYSHEHAMRIKDLLTPVREVPIDSRQEQLSAIARELSTGASSVTEARSAMEQFIENFQNAGYDFVDAENATEFMDFLSQFEWKQRDKFFGSGVLSKYFNSIQERKNAGEKVSATKQSFYTWLSKEEGRYGTGVSYRSAGRRD